MITVDVARDLILTNVPKPEFIYVTAEKCCGFVLAENIFSPVDLPPFDQSAMDGYAISVSDVNKGITKFDVAGEVRAGGSRKIRAGNGKAVRIFTGAMVPSGYDCVVMQENVTCTGNVLDIHINDIFPGLNIRKRGSQIKKGQMALSRQTVINPAGAGFIASMGLTRVKSYQNPGVAVIATGDELVLPGRKPGTGEIYESNTVTIISALRQMGIDEIFRLRCRDRKEEMIRIVRSYINKADIFLFTGGISEGKYDLVKDVLMKAGVRTIFHGVKQKPGKPLYAGRKKKKIFFGLPGNPAAALTCFYEYVYPYIRKIQGFTEITLPVSKYRTGKPIRKKPGKAWFMKSKIMGNSVIPLDGQESFIMKSFAQADSLIYLPPAKEKVRKGEWVEVHRLPYQQ
ncbi:MAG: molybdopterin molybdotransferase MoeA [Bacteroidetes bacterium]|nr:molybdopterin molybdotransferase MoeA [Bacteroidota bacterium]